MSKFTQLGVIGQIVTVIGLAVGLAACDDPSNSASTAAANASAATDTGSSSTAATNSTNGESAVNSGTSEPQSITLAWDAPTQNTDGTALTDLQGYEILYGTSASSLTQKVSLSTGQQNYVLENLTSGTWYFEVVAVNAAGQQSGPSSVVSVTLS